LPAVNPNGLEGPAELKTLIANLLMPLPVALVLVFAGLLLLCLHRRRSGRSMLAGAFALVFLASWGPVADALLAPLEARHPPVMDPARLPGVEAVVVLGSGYNSLAELPITGQLDDSAVVRLAEGVRLYRQLSGMAGSPGARLIVAGKERTHQDGYVLALLALGVPPADVLPMGIVHDTAHEARRVRAMIEPGQPFLLVTSASHMDRSIRHFRRVGLHPVAAPTRHKSLREDRSRLDYWVPSARHLRKTERALYEYMGMVSIELDH